MQYDISTNMLSKSFNIKKNESEAHNIITGLIHRKSIEIDAVKNININVMRGEMIGFIGPNGAGKSTIIKILTGLMYPSSGQAEVLGLNPWKERKKLSYNIGTVFGQKSQLWYHLAPKDTFDLLAKIYELDNCNYKKQRDNLIDIFDLSELLDKPVRKMSLGQRVKCEIAASLLHKPKLIFLDEPTIGLDIVAKQQIRKALIDMNKELGSTIFITSHDAGDVESLCNRVIIIDHGSKVFDDSIATLKNDYLTYKDIIISFKEPIDSGFKLQNVKYSQLGNNSIKIRVNNHINSVGTIIQQIISKYPIADISINEQSLENIIRDMFVNKTYKGAGSIS